MTTNTATLAPRQGAVVLDLGSEDDLAELRSFRESEGEIIVCLRREGLPVPDWFATLTRELGSRHALVVIRYRGSTVTVTDCRGVEHSTRPAGLDTAVVGAVRGALDCSTPGYREVTVW
ncbi:hypothetical protein [Aeromicrobium sp. CTD01-1L150]|uniref:hypothetical protein n=1 Tax=Aeromicrobium sp. CTD01-1L150 TaxID=3341830 RepID=UPI0035C121AC